MEVVVSMGPALDRSVLRVVATGCFRQSTIERVGTRHFRRPCARNTRRGRSIRLDVNPVILTAPNGRPHDASAAVPPDYVDPIVAHFLPNALAWISQTQPKAFNGMPTRAVDPRALKRVSGRASRDDDRASIGGPFREAGVAILIGRSDGPIPL